MLCNLSNHLQTRGELEPELKLVIFTWSVNDVGSQELGPFFLVALLCNVTCGKKNNNGGKFNYRKAEDKLGLI